MDVRAGCTRQGEELRPRSGGDAVLGLDVIPIYLLGALTCLFIGVPVHEFHPFRFGGRRKAVRDRFTLQGGTGDFP